MKMICVDEKKFNQIFTLLDMKYSNIGRYMEKEETPIEFEGTDRWSMLCEFQSEIKLLKEKILKA